MANALREIAKWLKFDLELEHMLQIQDIRLVQLGFSHGEVMTMTLKERAEYIEIGENLKRIDQYQDAMLSVEAGTLANGFSDKKTRKKLYGQWDKTIKVATRDLEFKSSNIQIHSNKANGNHANQTGSASRKSPFKKEGTINLKDKIGSFIKKKGVT